MLYVTVGLSVMLGALAVVGARAVEEATELVFHERLSAAYTTAGILGRDFLHVARDVDEMSTELLTGDKEWLSTTAQRLLGHLSKTDPFPFFQVTGVWVLTSEGAILAVAGEPQAGSSDQVDELVAAAARVGRDRYAVLPAAGDGATGVPFATVLTRVDDRAGSATRLVAVHTSSLNSPAPYIPAAYWRAAPDVATIIAQHDRPEARYDLEVVDDRGFTVLAVGEDERPGEVSRHLAAIRDLLAQRRAATLLHEPSSDQAFQAHVMAVVPLGSSPFYVILEQPRDVALTLPMELRGRVLLVGMLGFLATLLVAWVTTRHVAKPTEQLTAEAQRMARGDLESPIRVSALDEVGRLAESLEAMRQQLREAYREINCAKEELEGQVKERTARLTEVLGKVISAQEEERRRLARELHDETAQTISALSIALDRARYGLHEAPQESLEQIQEAQDIVRHLLGETRRLIADLRPALLEDLGLLPAIRWYAETHLQEQGVATTVLVDQPAARLPPQLEVSLFRIVQEAINNIAKHARARQAQIRLSFSGATVSGASVRLVVDDDGRGFDVGRVLGPSASTQSVGLLGMQERVRLLNGRLDIRSEEGKGTQITVEVPIPAMPAGPAVPTGEEQR